MQKIKSMGSVILLLFIMNFGYTQSDLQDVDFYQTFGKKILKGRNLGQEIQHAIAMNNAKSLGGYAAILFYLERTTGKKVPQATGLKILETATQTALSQRDFKALQYLASIWEEPFFGPANKAKAESLRRYIKKQENSQQALLLLPNWKKVKVKEKVVFRAVFSSAKIQEIAEEEIVFRAKYGKFYRNHYIAPNFACTDLIDARHISTGKTARAIMFVQAAKTRKIALIPTRKTVYVNDRFLFQVVYWDNFDDVPASQISFQAKYGKFRRNVYYAPSFSCIDYIKVRHYTSGNTARAIVRVMLKKINYGVKIDATKHYSSDPEMAQKVLMESEALRLYSINALIEKVKKTVFSIQGLYKIKREVVFSRHTFMAGVKTGKTYIYKSRPNELRLTVSVGKKWVVESIRRVCKNKGIEFTSEDEEHLLESLPTNIVYEGATTME